jgi:hypothetical protein
LARDAGCAAGIPDFFSAACAGLEDIRRFLADMMITCDLRFGRGVSQYGGTVSMDDLTKLVRTETLLRSLIKW